MPRDMVMVHALRMLNTQASVAASMRCFCVLLLAIGVIAAAGVSGQKQAIRADAPVDTVQEVTHIPGYKGALPSKHFSGYITVSDTHERRLFYWLVTSEGPATDKDPLVLWLTGGPGCSSLDAFTYEIGPFTFGFKNESAANPQARDIVLTRNPHAWSRAASVLFVDSPAGTGLSYSKVIDDYYTDDAATISDLHTFMLRFYELFPELQERDLYISGESYSGVYVPLLAQRILDGNDRAAAARQSRPQQHGRQMQQGSVQVAPPNSIPLVGFLVGNGVTDERYDEGASQIEFAWSHGLIDPNTRDMVTGACQGNARTSNECQDALGDMNDRMGDINPYDILDPCYFHHSNTTSSSSSSSTSSGGSSSSGSSSSSSRSKRRFNRKGASVGQQRLQAARQAFATPVRTHQWRVQSQAPASVLPGTNLGHTISCADRRAGLLFYNDPDVRKAIHGAPLEVSGRWEPCSDVLHYHCSGESMIAVHADLLKRGLRALILSGDHDYVIPFEGTRGWVYSMDLTPLRSWAPWHLEAGNGRQVAGYYVVFEEGLTFASVKGAGHMVPQTKPEASLRLLELFLKDEL